MPKYEVNRTVTRSVHEMFTIEAESEEEALRWDGDREDCEDYDEEHYGIVEIERGSASEVK